MEKGINIFDSGNFLDGGDSIVIRIEKLLAGESFDQLNDMSVMLINFYNSYFSERISECKKELFSMPPKEQDEEYLQYLEILNLIDNVTILNKSEIEKLGNVCNEMLNSIECNMSQLSIIPDHCLKIESEDEFDISEFNMNDEIDISEINYFKKYMKKYMPLPKREKLEQNIKIYENQLKQNKIYLDEKICFAINRDVLFKNFDDVQNILKNIKSKTKKNLEVVIDDERIMSPSKMRVPYNYNEKELSCLQSLVNDKIVQGLYFSEFHPEGFYPVSRKEIFEFTDVYMANLEKNDFVKEQKELKLSPFEFILSSHFFIREIDYQGDVSLNLEKSRTFLTADGSYSFDDSGFVCSAFSSYGKAMVDDYDDKNLKCDFVTIKFYDKETKDLTHSHTTLIVYIKDEKYDINGYYLWDLTYDSAYMSIAHCLFPISDLSCDKEDIAMVVDMSGCSDYVKIITCFNDELNKLNKTYEDINILKYKDKSKPIDIETYKLAIMNLMNKIEKSGDEKLSEFFGGYIKSKQEFLDTCLNDSICNLDIFDPLNAQNSFYKKMRDFYSNSSSKKYKNWEQNWEKCNIQFLKDEKLEW